MSVHRIKVNAQDDHDGFLPGHSTLRTRIIFALFIEVSRTMNGAPTFVAGGPP
jgi:hypothetical protein